MSIIKLPKSLKVTREWVEIIKSAKADLPIELLKPHHCLEATQVQDNQNICKLGLVISPASNLDKYFAAVFGLKPILVPTSVQLKSLSIFQPFLW